MSYRTVEPLEPDRLVCDGECPPNAGASHVKVLYRRTAGGAPLGEATTDGGGWFRFVGVSPAPKRHYTVSLEARDGHLVEKIVDDPIAAGRSHRVEDDLRW